MHICTNWSIAFFSDFKICGAFIKQIVDYLIVYLHIRNPDTDFCVVTLKDQEYSHFVRKIKQLFDSHSINSIVIRAALLSYHSMCFTRWGLAICKDSAIIAFSHPRNDIFAEFVVDLSVWNLLVKDCIYSWLNDSANLS